MVFQNFIVLGIIPGTNIQINFQQWLLAFAALLLLWTVLHYALQHRHKVTATLIPTIGGDIITVE